MAKQKQLSKPAKKAARKEHEAQQQARLIELGQRKVEQDSCISKLERTNRRIAKASDQPLIAKFVEAKYALVKSFGFDSESD